LKLQDSQIWSSSIKSSSFEKISGLELVFLLVQLYQPLVVWQTAVPDSPEQGSTVMFSAFNFPVGSKTAIFLNLANLDCKKKE
jgi:hypothetical protein